jgi:hypothetical protein
VPEQEARDAAEEVAEFKDLVASLKDVRSALRPRMIGLNSAGIALLIMFGLR